MTNPTQLIDTQANFVVDAVYPVGSKTFGHGQTRREAIEDARRFADYDGEPTLTIWKWTGETVGGLRLFKRA